MSVTELLRRLIHDIDTEHHNADDLELEETEEAEKWREGYKDGLWFAEQLITQSLHEAEADVYFVWEGVAP